MQIIRVSLPIDNLTSTRPETLLNGNVIKFKNTTISLNVAQLYAVSAVIAIQSTEI